MAWGMTRAMSEHAITWTGVTHPAPTSRAPPPRLTRSSTAGETTEVASADPVSRGWHQAT